MTTSAGASQPGFDALTERVNGIQGDFASFRDSITASISALSAKLDERGRTPWGHISSAMGVLLAVLTTVGGLALTPMKDGQAKLEAALEKFSDHVVSEKEFTTIIGNVGARRDDAQRVTEGRFYRVEADVDRLQGAIVPPRRDRAALDVPGPARRRDLALGRRSPGRMEGIYSPKDQIQSMQRHIEDLEAARARR